MSASAPTNAEVRDAARSIAPELTTVLGAAESAVPVGVVLRLVWVRAMAGLSGIGVDNLLAAQAYLLAHRCTRDLAGSQGSTSAPIGGGATAGAITSATTGPLSLGFGASAVAPPPAGSSQADAELGLTTAGQAFLSLRDSRPKVVVPRVGW